MKLRNLDGEEWVGLLGLTAIACAIATLIAAVVGWIWNIGKLFGALANDPWTMQVLIRAIGVVFAPLGAVVGWF